MIPYEDFQKMHAIFKDNGDASNDDLRLISGESYSFGMLRIYKAICETMGENNDG